MARDDSAAAAASSSALGAAPASSTPRRGRVVATAGRSGVRRGRVPHGAGARHVAGPLAGSLQNAQPFIAHLPSKGIAVITNVW